LWWGLQKNPIALPPPTPSSSVGTIAGLCKFNWETEAIAPVAREEERRQAPISSRDL